MKEMTKTTLKIDGMMCGMCESHLNDAIRQNIPVKKVTSSHKNGETVILSEEPIPRETLEQAIAPTGYKLLSVSSEPYEKKRLFGF